MKAYFLVFCSAVLGLSAGGELRDGFIKAQIHDPLNAVHSYNLGIAALHAKKYEEAEDHLSLATELSDRESADIIPAYFSWGDTAALRLIDALQKEAELRDAALDEALRRAVDAGNRYGNVLVFDENHAQARARKKIVDRLRALLEQRKKQQEEEQKQKEQQQKQEQDQQKQEKEQQKQKEEQKKQQKEETKQQKEEKKSEKEEKKGEKKAQNQEAGQKEEPQKQGETGQGKKSDDQQQGGQDQQDKQAAKGDPSPEVPASNKKDTSDKEKSEAVGDEQPAGDAAAEGDRRPEHAEKEAAAEESPDAAAQAGAGEPARYDANAEMAKKRALVLLDSLDRDEAALRKQQLLKKSAEREVGHARFNQW